ncbi:glycosyhydrolase [Filimonas effusa]|uniref:Glycosyhydrolase n=1 Tax=Filimonas effusa TaxID=2508721 RepID=A0A4Q1DFG9_9BACT|nr:glycosyhydrolase [Filimonas effusa]
MQKRKLYTIVIFSALLFLSSPGAEANTPPVLVSDIDGAGAFPLAANHHAASIYYSPGEFSGVIRAIGDLQNDIERVTHYKPGVYGSDSFPAMPVIIGTIGKNKWIDRLIGLGSIKAEDLKGKWESFVITTVANPFPGVQRALVIAGSDKRGSIFGIYELSKQLGVSPWYWWADVPVQKRSAAYILPAYFASGEPKVKYRGIFINDENPAMQEWARLKFGGMNSKMYGHVFELMLRLRANLLWPGMWGAFKEYAPGPTIVRNEKGEYEGNSFNEDDPDNPRLANEYGIIMGTSHHEPMQRSQQEWIRNKQNYGNGEWNYVTNKEGIRKFFREGIENTKNYESLITMGMRGDDDKPMADAGSAEANFRVLEGIMKDQRAIIEQVTQKPAAKTPQVWTLYSEVLEYFDQGMKVPDDMIIVLCDDNWGNVRRLPDLKGKKHPAGYGMYYHAAYYGAPRAYKWLNVTQIQHVWEQMQLTYSYGVDKLWILNVGDLKPMEFPMSFFLDMAWNPEQFDQNNLFRYTVDFCAQQFGNGQAREAARILNDYSKYAHRITPEMLDEKTYNLENGEFKMVTDELLALEARALRQFHTLDTAYRDAYIQLLLYPVQALANLYDMYYALAMNRKLAADKDTTANFWADEVAACFMRDSLLTSDFHTRVANGKWNRMMQQTHIGYTKWHGPQYNVMPRVTRIQPEEMINGSYLFSEKSNVVVMEAAHYYKSQSSAGTAWSVIPGLGRTLSGLELLPPNLPVEGASLTYKMQLKSKADSVKVLLVFSTVMPFIKGGSRVTAGFKGGAEKSKVINDQLTWKNNYSIMYPTAAARVIETSMYLPLPPDKNGWYELDIYPHTPGMVLQKVIVDCGGYEKTFLHMNESPHYREPATIASPDSTRP